MWNIKNKNNNDKNTNKHISAKNCDATLAAPPTPPMLVDPLTTTTTTTTGNTITNNVPPSLLPVRAASDDGVRVNLIAQMINDVSKTLAASASPPTWPKAPTATHDAAAAGNAYVVVVVAGDFPTYTSSPSTDASNMTNTTSAIATGKNKLTTAHNDSLAAGDVRPARLCVVNRVDGPQQAATAATPLLKSKSTENKWQYKELTSFSYQRELTANTSTAEATEQLTTTTKRTSSSTTALKKTNKSNKILDNLPKGLNAHTTQGKEPLFAQRNAILKTRFLAHCESNDNSKKTTSPANTASWINITSSGRTSANKTTGASKSTIATAADERRINDTTSLPDSACTILSRNLNRRTNAQLKLRIPSGLASESVNTVTKTIARRPNSSPESSNLSLVAQRKLELKRKFKTNSAVQQHHLSNIYFPSVAQLRHKFNHTTNFGKKRSCYHKMIVNPNKPTDNTAGPEIKLPSAQLLALKPDVHDQRHSPLSDEGCNLGQSPYSSDNEDNESIRTTATQIERKRKEKVARSASSDSALGLEVDDPMMDAPAVPPSGPQPRRMTLTVTDLPLRPALLPLPEPTALPDSPTNDLQTTLQGLLAQSTVPSKVLLEERVVQIPEDPHNAGCDSLASSRRESAQSCLSDYPNSECSGVRFVRTPSVVVSDYSDDVMCGLTLEEIEYLRAQRMRRRRSSLETAGTEKDNEGVCCGSHSDVSASSSCSNLYYCGSTISALDGAECYINGMRMPLAERKVSGCSTCSASGADDDEEEFSIPEQPEDPAQMGRDLAELLAAQHLSTQRSKKVGMCAECIGGGLNIGGLMTQSGQQQM